MFKKKKDYVLQSYRKDPITKAFVIEVSLDDYSDVFNDWDPAPFKRRDIDPDFQIFLEESSEDIPIKYPLNLCLHLPKDEYDEEKEAWVMSGLRNNFMYNIHYNRKEIQKNRRKIMVYVIMAFLFLSLAFLFEKQIEMKFFRTTIIEGLFIGGWVFLWEAFSLFFFTGQDFYYELKKYQRFLNTDIDFKYIA